VYQDGLVPAAVMKYVAKMQVLKMRTLGQSYRLRWASMLTRSLFEEKTWNLVVKTCQSLSGASQHACVLLTWF